MQASPFGTSVKGFRDGGRARAFVRIDPLLLLAALGLIGCSLYTLGSATKDDIPGNPNYYVTRQGDLRGVGILLMLLLSRVDYSRMREWRPGIYVAMIGLDRRSSSCRRRGPRVAARDRPAASSAPDRPSSARCC